MLIKLTKTLTERDSDLLFRWRERVFPEEGRKINWSEPEWHLVAYNRERDPIAHLSYSGFTIGLDKGRQQAVVGVGGVVVRPEQQGKNIPLKLFDHLHSSPHALEISNTFTLFCPLRLGSYYQRHGYQPFTGEFTFVQGAVATTTEEFMFMYRGADLSTRVIELNNEPW